MSAPTLDVRARPSNVNSYPKEDRSRPAAGRFCVLVNSSDRARDIFEIVFQNSETIGGIAIGLVMSVSAAHSQTPTALRQ